MRLGAWIIPARFEIIRRRLLFFKNILNENPNSLIFKFIQLQIEKPTKGDWAFSCLASLKHLNIKLSIEQIAIMKKQKRLRSNKLGLGTLL